MFFFFFHINFFRIQTTECTNFLLELGGDMSYLKWFDLRSGGCCIGSFPYHCCYHVDSLRMTRTLLQILSILLEMPEAFIAIIFYSMNQ